MISETQMDELADKLSGQDLELGIKAATITIETAMRQCHSQIDILQRFIAIVQNRENETLRQENAALRKRVQQLEEKLSVAASSPLDRDRRELDAPEHLQENLDALTQLHTRDQPHEAAQRPVGDPYPLTASEPRRREP